MHNNNSNDSPSPLDIAAAVLTDAASVSHLLRRDDVREALHDLGWAQRADFELLAANETVDELNRVEHVLCSEVLPPQATRIAPRRRQHRPRGR